MKAAVLAFAIACSLGGCRKKGGEVGPGVGGGWVVGERGMMINVHADGSFSDYDLEIGDDLLDIACRGTDSAFVVGTRGTFLRTFDGGAEWESIELGTRGALRSVAAASREFVVVAGDEGLFLSADSGTTWSTLATGSFASVALDHTGDVIMALDRGGTVWREDRSASLRPVFASAGAVALAMNATGERAAVLTPGRTLWLTDDGGGSWQPLELGGAYDLRSGWITASGELIAVGTGGVVVHVDARREVNVQRPARGDLDAVHLGSSGIGYAGGADGRLLHTLDGGVTWAPLSRSAPQRVLSVDQIHAPF